MSKIGTKQIEIPEKVTIEINRNKVKIKGTLGELDFILPRHLEAIKADKILNIKRSREDASTKALHGLFRQLIYNAVVGVEKPWVKRLEVVGTGFNAKMQGEDVVLKVGFSHPVIFKKTAGIKFQVEGNNKIVVSGIDKQLVGQVAYQLKMVKKPDVYKGKGVRYEGEKLRIKPGKKAKAAGAAA